MVQIISGKKGKGKTKYLLDSVNGAVASAQGSVVYLDKTAKHMYELSKHITQFLYRLCKAIYLPQLFYPHTGNRLRRRR